MRSGTLEFIQPDWAVSPRVRAFTTIRAGGCSQGVFASLNLATHVGDDPAAVRINRARLHQALNLPAEPLWLDQVHGTRVHKMSEHHCDQETQVRADASFTHHPHQVCAILTADCLPVLLCERDGRAVAAVHAGWRGLAAGIIEQTLAHFEAPPAQIIAWLGPAIGPRAFEVGPEVRDAFLSTDPEAHQAFMPSPAGRWLADLYSLARQRLKRAGVLAMTGGQFCTHQDADRFYSYRRDGQTGRIASLIWIATTTN